MTKSSAFINVVEPQEREVITVSEQHSIPRLYEFPFYNVPYYSLIFFLCICFLRHMASSLWAVELGVTSHRW